MTGSYTITPGPQSGAKLLAPGVPHLLSVQLSVANLNLSRILLKDRRLWDHTRPSFRVSAKPHGRFGIQSCQYLDIRFPVRILSFQRSRRSLSARDKDGQSISKTGNGQAD